MTFKRLNNFTTENAAKLGRELPQFEDNAAQEFGAVRRELLPVLSPVSFTAMPQRGIIAILPDQQLSVDTTLAAASVVFPPIDTRNFGRRFVLVKRNPGGGSVLTSCQDPTVKCNGSVFPTIAAAGVTVFFLDASGYYH